MLLPLGNIPHNDFTTYLLNGLQDIGKRKAEIAEAILTFTKCHPYYTQQLAFMVWDIMHREESASDPIGHAVSLLISMHDMDYEQMWKTFNKTDKKLLIGLSLSDLTPLSEAFYRKYNIGAPSTAYSSLKRLMVTGHITKSENRYCLDDPFFCQWIKMRREK